MKRLGKYNQFCALTESPSSTQVALYNHLALVLHKHQSQLEDYEFRFHQLKSDLQLAIANVTDRFKGLTEEGLVQRLPISA